MKAEQGMRNFEARRQLVIDFYKQWKRDWLKSHPGQKKPRVWNYSLRDYIYVTKLSRGETAFHSVYSLSAIRMIRGHFDEILKYAVKKSTIQPKNNSHQSGFSRLIVMERKVSGIGTAKLTIGVRTCDGKKEQYCITAIQ